MNIAYAVSYVRSRDLKPESSPAEGYDGLYHNAMHEKPHSCFAVSQTPLRNTILSTQHHSHGRESYILIDNHTTTRRPSHS